MDVAYGLVVIYIEFMASCIGGRSWGCINADTRSEEGVSLSAGQNGGEDFIPTRPMLLYPIPLPAWYASVLIACGKAGYQLSHQHPEGKYR